MKALIVTENSYAGGMDSFLIALINNWPHPEDELYLLCNQDHPGLSVIADRTSRPCQFVGHRIVLLWQVLAALERWRTPVILRKTLSAGLRYPFFVIYVVAMAFQFRRFGADRMMAVSGGYPGGETCRAAVLAWRWSHSRSPAVLNIHNFAVSPRRWQAWPERILDRAIARASRFLVTVSHACAGSFKERAGLADANIRVVYNGIQSQIPQADRRDAVRKDLGVPPGAKMLIMLATYEARKGHEFLFRAIRRAAETNPNVFLVVCGYGQEADMDRVQALIDQLNVQDHVALHGFRDDVAAMIAAAEVMVVPSQKFESFGLTAVEAMAMGVPVIATTVGGLPEVLDHGAAGILVPPDDEDELARQINTLLRDQTLYDRLSAAGKARYTRSFQASRMASEYAALLRNETQGNGQNASA